MDVLTSETCRALNEEMKKQLTSSWSLFIQLSVGHQLAVNDSGLTGGTGSRQKKVLAVAVSVHWQ